jgi:hypothetical protein
MFISCLARARTRLIPKKKYRMGPAMGKRIQVATQPSAERESRL